MADKHCIAVLGTFDSRAEEHRFLKRRIELRGLQTLTINVGTRAPSPVKVDVDLFDAVKVSEKGLLVDRDSAINAMLEQGKALINQLYQNCKISGIINDG